MDVDSFFKKVTQPEAWREKARALRRSGDVLWRAYSEQFERGGSPAEIVDLMTSSLMLYGFSLEVAMKGRLIDEDPGSVRLHMVANGSGEMQGIEIRKLGVDNHNLESLG